MKKLITLLTIVLLTSCSEKKEEKYPTYKIITSSFVPDSLKKEYRIFITETVRAASQHMTGGDYEDADETIEQAQETAFKIFSIEKPALIVKYADWEYMRILEQDMNEKEKAIFKKLINQ